MKVFIPENYSTDAMARLRANRGIELVEDIGACEAMLIRSQTKIDSSLLTLAPRLRFVATATSGFDHIDWRACQNRGIVACFTPEANAGSTAELTLFLILSLLKRPIEQIDNVRKGKWREGLARGESLEGKMLGIVGLGRIGGRVAKLGQAFGMRVIAYDPYIAPESFHATGADRHSLIEVLRMSDVVSLHVPLTKETKHLINQATIKEMSPHCFLLNVSRGAVVDESEVLVALREHRLQGAALDVLEREPPLATNEMLRHPRAIVTPHVGAYSIQTFENASIAAVDRLFAHMEGKTVADTLPLSAPWFELSVAK